MPRSLASLTALGLFVGCATSPRLHPEYLATTEDSHCSEPSFAANDEGALEALDTRDLLAPGDLHAPDAFVRPDFFSSPEPLTLQRSDSKRTSSGDYATLKGGWLYPEESDFDSGYIFNAAFGHYVAPFLAVEFEGGYAAPDPNASSADLYAIPLLVNARVGVPVWLVEMYGGAGIGSMYYDLDTRFVDSTGWLLTGDMFVGADIQLFDKLTAGLELKYYFTDKLRNTSDNLNSLAVMATFGWKF